MYIYYHTYTMESTKKRLRSTCPKGTRRNKKSGLCEPYAEKREPEVVSQAPALFLQVAGI